MINGFYSAYTKVSQMVGLGTALYQAVHARKIKDQ
jgi:hypothetical protein